jgi:hypothetical protein
MENTLEYITGLILDGYTSGNDWDLSIELDTPIEQISLENISGLIKDGFTEGNIFTESENGITTGFWKLNIY